VFRWHPGLKSPHASESLFGRSRKSALATRSGLDWQGPEGTGNCLKWLPSSFRDAPFGAGPESITTIGGYGFLARGFASPRNNKNRGRNDGGDLRPCPLVADAQQFHRSVGNRDPEGGADGALDQMDVAAMGADQFGGNRKA
jgi:hypothetical protein